MKKIKVIDSIPLDQKQFTKGSLTYRKNRIISKRSHIKIWESETSFFYDIVPILWDVFNKHTGKAKLNDSIAKIPIHSIATISF